MARGGGGGGVPQFGNWDTNNTRPPFTQVFNTARAGRGKMINPNDPSELAEAESAPPAPPARAAPVAPPATKRSSRKSSQDEGEMRRYVVDSPARKQHLNAAAAAAPSTPSRQRSTSSRGRVPAPSPPRESAPALPKFGDWNAMDAEGYTVIFDDARNAKKNPRGAVPPSPQPQQGQQRQQHQKYDRQQKPEKQGWLCCFSS